MQYDGYIYAETGSCLCSNLTLWLGIMQNTFDDGLFTSIGEKV